MTSTSTTRRAFLAGLASTGGALVARPATTFAQDARRGVLKYATYGLDTSDPHRHTGSIAVQQAYVEALTSIAADGSVEPFLAESYDVSPDGRTYTFRLRRGVRFHDGSPLTAADVAANFQRIRDRVKGGWLVSAMGRVEALDTPDEATVVVRLKAPYAPLLNLLSELWIVSPRSPGWDGQISQPIGTGPFTFDQWQPKVRLVAPAFDGYWRTGAPRLTAVEFDLRGGVDKSLALRAGELDVIDVDTQTAQVLEKTGAARLAPLKDTTWYSIAFNNRSPRKPFDDLRVREALALAVDKAAVMKFIGGARGVPTNQMVAPGHVYFDAAYAAADPFRKRDLDRAKQLLKHAGVEPAAQRLEFVSWQEPYAQIIVQMVRQLGFQVNHTALDDIGAQKRLGQYDWDMNAMASGPRADVFLRYVRLMSDGPNPVLWGGIQDPELDRLIDAAVAETDPAQRRERYLQAFRRTQERGYFHVLGHAPSLIAIRNGIDGYEPGYTWACHWASGGVSRTSLRA